MSEFVQPLIGGLLIGLAATLMLLLNGRVLGVSGILGGLISPHKNETFWRICFILGLITGGFLISIFLPIAFNSTINISNFQVILSGLLVGFGTLLGGGCTSGHGVCGISRLSVRSAVATIVFMLAGIIIVVIAKNLGFFL